MKSLIAIGIVISPLGQIPAVKIFIKAVRGLTNDQNPVISSKIDTLCWTSCLSGRTSSDVQEIVETATPMGAAISSSGRILKECTPPELLIAGKCIMLTGGVIASFATGGNPLAISGKISAFRSIIKN